MENDKAQNSGPAPLSPLPHQPSDIKPDEIVEYEQEFPEVLVNATDHARLRPEEKAVPAELSVDDPALKPYLEKARRIKTLPPQFRPPEARPAGPGKWLAQLKKIFKK